MDRFNEAYRGARSAPPWDIGRPQPAFVALAEQDAIRGSVLDAGCGTGEHTLYFASLGHESWGNDGSPLAIERARQKALERGLAFEFRVHDALTLEGLERTFDNVTDCGLFHIFGDEDRALSRVWRASSALAAGTSCSALATASLDRRGHGAYHKGRSAMSSLTVGA